MSRVSLSLNKLTKIFPNGVKALSGIDITVHKGEFVSIIGPSGCGKTTLFNIISGIEKETSGTIKINGRATHKRDGKFGYMLQEPLLLPWRTVEENIILGLDVKSISRTSAIQRARALLEKFKLSDFAKFYPDSLSGGMQQRVALLRTVLFHDDFLILDEPFGSLDALTRLSAELWLMDVFMKLKPTIILVTHDVREAILMSDTIFILSHRPAKVLQKIKITIPRPRNPKFMASTDMVKLEQKLVSMLLKEQEFN